MTSLEEKMGSSVAGVPWPQMATPAPSFDGCRADFTCAICRRLIEMRWNRPGRGECIPPICLYCEGQFSSGVGKPAGGSFRDRRTVIRGFAIAEALRTAAAHKKWGSSFAEA